MLSILEQGVAILMARLNVVSSRSLVKFYETFAVFLGKVEDGQGIRM